MLRFILKRSQPHAPSEHHAVDDLAELFSEGMTRRLACKALGGGALGTVFAGLWLTGAAASCKPLRARCRRSSECCSRRCVQGRCRPKPPQPPLRQLVGVTAFVDIVDDESWPFDDEHCHGELSQQAVLTTDQPQKTFVLDKGCGGEVLIRLSLTAQLLDNGDVRVAGEVLLFEGIDETPGDLDGRALVQETVVPKGQTVTSSVGVANTDEGGDKATVHMTFSNTTE